MKEKPTQLELIQKEWDAIICYERCNYQQSKNNQIPVNQLINYFGYETICQLFGCQIASPSIAIAIIKEFFK